MSKKGQQYKKYSPEFKVSVILDGTVKSYAQILSQASMKSVVRQ